MSEAEQAMHGAPHARIQRFKHWPALTLIGVVLVFAACVSLWQFAALRPYLATAGAGVATFGGALPGLLTPEMRGKWLFALAISTLITAGVWFATKDLENQVRHAEIGIEQSNTRFTEQAASIEGIVNKLSPQAQDEVLLQAGGYFRGLWRAKKFQAILDMALPLLEVNPDNGHVLYYAGEVYRELGNREQMRGLFQKFIAAAVENPDAKTGAAAVCYQRSGGFCQERLGWIYHLMASDYLVSSRSLSGTEKVEALRTSFQYERWDIELRQTVFFDNGSAPGSCDILLAITTELTTLRRDASDIIAFGRDGPGQCTSL